MSYYGLYDGELKKLNTTYTAVEPVLACHVRAIVDQGRRVGDLALYKKNILRLSFGLKVVKMSKDFFGYKRLQRIARDYNP